jgi:hypothetical protein
VFSCVLVLVYVTSQVTKLPHSTQAMPLVRMYLNQFETYEIRSLEGREFVDSGLVGCYKVYSPTCLPTFRRNLPSSFAATLSIAIKCLCQNYVFRIKSLDKPSSATSIVRVLFHALSYVHININIKSA